MFTDKKEKLLIDFQDKINTILPRYSDYFRYYKAFVTTSNGEQQGFNAKRNGRIHAGVDFNYHLNSNTPLGQNGVNLEHPPVNSPVTGYVSDTKKAWGMIEITDSDHYRHQIRHLYSIALNIGDTVDERQHIGNMGGRGSNGASQFDQHVHYSILTQKNNSHTGNLIDPEAFWNNNFYYVINAGSLNHLPLVPTNQLDPALQEKLHGLSQGLNILSDGETLRREGNHVWRIEPNGTTRGYFISE